MKKVLELIDQEGLENRWKRHIEMSKYARDWVNSHNQNLFTKNDAISCTLTCVRNVQEWDIEKISQRLFDNGYRMDRGYGKFRYKTFRIPHMGNIYLDDLKEYLNIFENSI